MQLCHYCPSYDMFIYTYNINSGNSRGGGDDVVVVVVIPATDDVSVKHDAPSIVTSVYL